MNQSRVAGIIVGLFFCIGVAAILLLTLRVSNIETYEGTEGYSVKAAFEDIGGLRPGSAVRMAGVLVDRVKSIELNENFEAIVSMNLRSEFDQIPADSSASILTAGLLGEQYIGLSPGGFPEPLEEGSTIEFTQSALVLERLIGQLVFSVTGDKKGSSETEDTAQ